MGRCGALDGGGRRARKGGLRDELGEALAAEVAALIGAAPIDGADFAATETGLRDGMLRLAGRALGHTLNADHSDGLEAHRPCTCGGRARFAGRRPRTLVTVLGEIEKSLFMRPAKALTHVVKHADCRYPKSHSGASGQRMSLLPAITSLS